MTNEYTGLSGETVLFEYYESDSINHLPREQLRNLAVMAFHKGKLLIVNNITKNCQISKTNFNTNYNVKPAFSLYFNGTTSPTFYGSFNNVYFYPLPLSITGPQGPQGFTGPQGIAETPGQGLLSVNGTINTSKVLNLSSSPITLINGQQYYSIIVDSFWFYNPVDTVV